MPSVAIIIPTTGAAALRQCITSVLTQQGGPDIKLFIVIDGPEFAEAFRHTTAGLDLRGVHICQLPANVGRNGFYGHRVYAAFSHLIDTDYVCFLDQDNWLDPGHVASLVDAVVQQDWDWAFALRKVVSADGLYLVDDESQSVGPWGQAQPMPLVDTNCYCLRTEVAQRVASHWHGGWGQDRVFYAALSHTFPNFGSSGRYTVHYRTRDDMQAAVIGLLTRENARQQLRFPDGLPWVGAAVAARTAASAFTASAAPT